MKNIANNYMVTATCPNCGVELTCSALSPATKCHWCHTLIPATLYVENPNMPEQILPFKIDKKRAKSIIDNYMNKRQTYSTEEFLNNYNSNNIVAVYLPYMLVDINLHSENRGVLKNYTLIDNVTDNEYISRDFDMTIENALVEASKSSFFNSINSTSNVISSVVPFDIENAVEFNTNYLNGYLSENRELNLDILKPQINKIVENNTNKFLYDEMQEYYDTAGNTSRKTYWYHKKNTILGSQWSSIFLPVWIYSYCEKVDGVNKIYYIAVNGRTGKIVGSIPINKKKYTKLKISLNIVFYILFTVYIYIFYYAFFKSKGIPLDAIDMDYFAITSVIFIISMVVAYIIKRKIINGKLSKIKNDYINTKRNHNVANTNVVVYDWKYEEHYYRSGAL